VLARTIHRQDRGNRLTWLELVGPRLSRSDEAGAGASHLYEYGWTLGFRISPAPGSVRGRTASCAGSESMTFRQDMQRRPCECREPCHHP
jgi:hypothetical protein